MIMMRAVWFFVLILLVVTPQRVCTCQHEHEHQAHVPVAPADPVDDASCLTTDSEQGSDCQCKTRIGDTPKRVVLQFDELVAFLPAVANSDNRISQVESSTFVKQAHIPSAVPLYLSTSRLRP
jgi:hypothetical protein